MVVPLIQHKDNGKQELCNCSMSIRTLSQSNASWDIKEPCVCRHACVRNAHKGPGRRMATRRQ